MQAEELIARVASIDIAKASGMVCVRVPHEDKPGKRVQQVFNTVATSGAILDLADHLICQGVTRVVMETTLTYWKPYFFLLESRGLECWLVNARDVKDVPGRPRAEVFFAGNHYCPALCHQARYDALRAARRRRRSFGGGELCSYWPSCCSLRQSCCSWSAVAAPGAGSWAPRSALSPASWRAPSPASTS
ncbi:hypothetical protein ACIO6T_44990 [Streptomyces sp. NPDC087532]|uniref:hypothetical protein n=1 Tax=unclassified Streptomyces TaxID=2593676 RepID=UPI0037F3048E